MQEITSITELTEVVNNNSEVVIDLFATWCIPCQEMLPVVTEIAESAPVPFYKIDIDKVPEAKKFTGAKAVPMIIMYKEGRVREFAFGVTPREKIEQKMNRLLK
jgi:thiol-disulfide isomerase/thioredoxin